MGRGPSSPAFAGTAWGAFNAVTEYLGGRGRTPESRLASSLVGDNARAGDKALTVLLEMVQAQ